MSHEPSTTTPTCTTRRREPSYTATLLRVTRQCTTHLQTRENDDTYIADGERVVVLARYSATHKGTGKAMEARVAHSFVVRLGRIVRMEQIVDSTTVRAAMQ
ncbi:hypothetical protein DSC45_12395 [Streptomyces sp. YIM 130001]|nr:hypothetical protein DSC45_12395 [Streptomyces sp. YIM 130001]